MSWISAVNTRGTFHGVYAIPSKERRRPNSPRFLECILCTAQSDDPDYFLLPGTNEFSVVDLRTKEKAWLEVPSEADTNTLTQMIESHFAASSCQVAPFLWVV